MGSPRPIFESVTGAPFQPREIVRVVVAVDQEVHDVSEFIGRLGIVKHLEYECGCGQTFPGDPMIGIRFSDGRTEEFWREEIVQAKEETVHV